jgi:hypothetical protein
MSDEEPITLKAVQARLGAPPHVLIHLCEKGVIQPDFAETSGRGNRRGFSSRNLFEFALALALRKLDLPVGTTGLIVRTTRSFARAVGKLVPGFQLPEAFRGGQLGLELMLYDGDQLLLVAKGASFKRPLLLEARIGTALRGRDTTPRVAKLDSLPERFETRLQVDLCEVAAKVLK